MTTPITKDEWVALLKTNVEDFNTARSAHGYAVLDLRNISIHGADLRYADLRNADLSGNDLHRADLRDSNLCNADLGNTDLSNADLQGSNLWRSHLPDANLQNANFQDANFRMADLRRASLQNANLQGANLQDADLRWADLRKTKGIALLDRYLIHGLTPGIGYKVVHEDGAPMQHTAPWGTYETGKTYTDTMFNPDPNQDCGAGINLASLGWLRGYYAFNDATPVRVLLFTYPMDTEVCIPYQSSGKFRVRQATCVAEVPASMWRTPSETIDAHEEGTR